MYFNGEVLTDRLIQGIGQSISLTYHIQNMLVFSTIFEQYAMLILKKSNLIQCNFRIVGTHGKMDHQS